MAFPTKIRYLYCGRRSRAKSTRRSERSQAVGFDNESALMSPCDDAFHKKAANAPDI